ncbi:MAG: sigma-70 family RNA polymerase sigma factor [Acidobacteriota bacterium]
MSSESDSTADGLLLATLESAPHAAPLAPHEEVLELFDQWGPRLRRYVGSFGLGSHDAEDIVQDVFLSLFRHVQLGRSRVNLKGWLFQVTHNLALKRRNWTRKRQTEMAGHAVVAARQEVGTDNPEEQLAGAERQQRLIAVFNALPDRDRRCLCLRAEGLRYREIANVLGISLGAVAKSLTRALERLQRADER